MVSVRINLSPTKAGNGFKPKKDPSSANDAKLSTAIAHK